MKKVLLSGLLLALSLTSLPQNTTGFLRDSIPQLNRPHRHLPKYVNYDVLKFMSGPGWAIPNDQKNGFALTYNLQILCPFPNLKKLTPFAWGINWGGNRFAVRNARIDFADNKFHGIEKDQSIRSTAHRSGYVGLLIMPVIRAKNFTILPGAAVNYIFRSRLIIRDGPNVYKISTRKVTNRINVPLHLQTSFSMRQIASFGLNISYDTKSKFKEMQTGSPHQATFTISAALIL